MPKKKTIEELRRQAEAAEERAKKLREQAKQMTQAEEAKLSAEIIRATEEWRLSLQPPVRREELPSLFRKWAAEKISRPDTDGTNSSHGPDPFSRKNRF